MSAAIDSTRCPHRHLDAVSTAPDTRPLMRDADEVMSLPRLGSLYPTRLSFARSLIRRMNTEGWRVRRHHWEMDADGYGTAVYAIDGAQSPLSFVAFTQALDPSLRTDRVIATQWDAAFALVSELPDPATLSRLRLAVPRQESGRMHAGDLVLSRANKSVRIFDHVCERLAQGKQPSAQRLAEVGYLMRTTAVYGNGKYGLSDMPSLRAQGVFTLPFQAEMLAVYLARELSADLAEHVAGCRAPQRAATLDPRLRRALGVGNATGLGMAPFLVTHPQLVHRWMWAREQALARVKGQAEMSDAKMQRMQILLERARAHVAQWRTEDARQSQRIDTLRVEMEELARGLSGLLARWRAEARPWLAMSQHVVATCSTEMQELLNALMLELHPREVNGLEQTMTVAEGLAIDPSMRADALAELIETRYAYALSIDFDAPHATARFWYVSQAKAEPRMGDRGTDPGDERETRIDVARQVAALHRYVRAVAARAPEARVAQLLLEAPHLRGIIARVQSVAGLDYAEVHGNVLGEECLPIDLLRAKLATFGASKFDPKSDRWTRITLFQGAPPASALADDDADDWWLPVIPALM